MDVRGGQDRERTHSRNDESSANIILTDNGDNGMVTWRGGKKST